MPNTFAEIQNEMRNIAKELLESGEATMVIGWEKGALPYQSTPVMIRSAADVDKLIWDEYCQQNLSTYLIMANACKECRYPNPVTFDRKIGEDVTPWCTERDFSDVEAIEALSADEKYAFWQSQYTKCIRCYACRNICPACNCTSCIFDQSASGWCSKDVNASENQFYGVTRAFHVAGRCIECGQCEMVCPSEVPIMLMNKKFIKDIDSLFGAHEAGLDIDTPAPLSHFSVSDPEEFM